MPRSQRKQKPKKKSSKRSTAGMLRGSQRFRGLKFRSLGPVIRDTMVYTIRSLRSLDFLDDQGVEDIYEGLGFASELEILRNGIRNEIYARPTLKYKVDGEEGRNLYVVMRNSERPFVDADLLHILNKEGDIKPMYEPGTDRRRVNEELKRLFPTRTIASNPNYPN